MNKEESIQKKRFEILVTHFSHRTPETLAKLYNNRNFLIIAKPDKVPNYVKVKCKCPICDSIFEAKYGSVLENKTICPVCREAVKQAINIDGKVIGDFEVKAHEKQSYERTTYIDLYCKKCGHHISPSMSELMKRINTGNIKCKTCDEMLKKQVRDARFKNRVLVGDIPASIKGIYAVMSHTSIYADYDDRHVFEDGKEYYSTKGVYKPWLEYNGPGIKAFYAWALQNGYSSSNKKYLHLKTISKGFYPENLYWDSTKRKVISHKRMADGTNIEVYAEKHKISKDQAFEIWHQQQK